MDESGYDTKSSQQERIENSAKLIMGRQLYGFRLSGLLFVSP
jgi:hypothetical protein